MFTKSSLTGAYFLFSYFTQKQDRNLKTDKLNVLRHKVIAVGNKLLEKNDEKISSPKLRYCDLALIEDELKPECDVLNSLLKTVSSTKTNLEKMSKENTEMKCTMEILKSQLLGKNCKILLPALLSS